MHTITIGERAITFSHPNNDTQLQLINTYGADDGAGKRVGICSELIESAKGFDGDPEPMQVFPFVTQLIDALMLGGPEGN